MEESVKRKERLKAMCMEATKPELNNQNSGNPSGHLVNPLAHCNPGSPAHENPASRTRFDYYTDPMSAYSSKKRSNDASVNMPSAYGSSPRAHPPPPFLGPRNTSTIPFHAPVNHFKVNSSPCQGTYRMQSPVVHSAPHLNPCGSNSPLSTQSPCGAPGMWNRTPSPSEFGNPPYPPRGGFMSPVGRGSPRSNSGRDTQSVNSGRGSYNSRFANSPTPFMFSSGFKNSPGHSGQSSSWTRGPVSADKAPEIFYSRVMVRDPWEALTPVVGSIMVCITPQKTPDPSSWLPASLATKKAKTAESVKAFQPQSSLAEYLALSFEEAAKDESEI